LLAYHWRVDSGALRAGVFRAPGPAWFGPADGTRSPCIPIAPAPYALAYQLTKPLRQLTPFVRLYRVNNNSKNQLMKIPADSKPGKRGENICQAGRYGQFSRTGSTLTLKLATTGSPAKGTILWATPPCGGARFWGNRLHRNVLGCYRPPLGRRLAMSGQASGRRQAERLVKMGLYSRTWGEQRWALMKRALSSAEEGVWILLQNGMISRSVQSLVGRDIMRSCATSLILAVGLLRLTADDQWHRVADLGLAMKPMLKLALFAPALLFVCLGCVAVPTGSRSEKAVICQRLGPSGECMESVEKEVITAKALVLVAPKGPSFVSEEAVTRIEYFLVDDKSRREKLPFLTKRRSWEDFTAVIPISGNRWLGLNRLDKYPIYSGLAVSVGVSVFNRHGVLFSREILGCYYNISGKQPGPFGAVPWRPLRDDIKAGGLNYRFEPATEEITFRTYDGDFVFCPHDGTVRKLNGGKS
jgi:hypothetical protein